MDAGHNHLLHGGAAVLFFYIVSGFYMALVLNEKYKIGVKSFYLARFMRIFATYWAAMAIMIAWTLWWGGVPDYAQLPLRGQVATVVMNAFIFGRGWFELAASGQAPLLADWAMSLFGRPFELYRGLIGQAWTLEVELGFYLVAPFIVRSPMRIALFFFGSFILRLFLVVSGVGTVSWGYYILPTTLCLFLLGGAAYWLYRGVVGWRWSRVIGMYAMVGMLAAAIAWGRVGSPAAQPSAWAQYDRLELWGSYLIFAFLLPFVFVRFKDNFLDRAIGELSYPLYLIHGLTLGIVINILNAGQRTEPVKLEAVGASLLAALVIHVLVERPTDLLRAVALRRATRFRLGTPLIPKIGRPTS